MKVIGALNVSDNHDGRTVYTVELDDGRTVDVVRNHFPPLKDSERLVYLRIPHDPDIDENAVIKFLRENCEGDDFTMPVFERQSNLSYAPVKDTCYSPEQAMYLAKKAWDERPDKNKWEIFRIVCGKKIIKDWLI